MRIICAVVKSGRVAFADPFCEEHVTQRCKERIG